MKTIKKLFFGCLLTGMMAGLFTACEENLTDALPANGNVAYVNFVNAGEAFLYGLDDTLYRDNRLYITDSVNNAPFDKYNGKVSYPAAFNYEPKLDIRQYPRHFTGVPGVVDNSARGDVYWLPVHAGDYRFIFTSRDRTYLHTQNIPLSKQTYQVLYLVESPEADDAYTVVEVPIERKDRVEGHVTVQFVNLSPDAGEVEAYRVDADGNELATATDTPLAFGEYSSAELATAGTQDTYNGILIRFRRPGGEDVQSVAVPANNGAVYTVLLRGFAEQTERKIKKDNETTVSVTVLPDLRTSIRRVFY
ncbi:hypothetical protein [Parapedobacter tibetensis]|uniref:hypothetical protein n=1 Tax=Parapedobacter tibetensis TaxID=2972951 RepID=UPI00214D6E8B|nr:hypothetical protein [Parapedobacter tibetensis]